MFGFILFWVAVGMIAALFLVENMVILVCIIIIFLLLGFNLFCH
jgi:hypothetical protein